MPIVWMIYLGLTKKISALDVFHRGKVPGVSVLPREHLMPNEVREVYLSLDSESRYAGEKGFFRRNLMGILRLLRNANPQLKERVGNVLLLDAYIAVACGIPTFTKCQPELQKVIVCLQNNCLVRPIFAQDCGMTLQFFNEYKDANVTLRQALESFLSREQGYKSEVIKFAILTQVGLCSQHMLSHFVNHDDVRLSLPGFFITDAPKSKEENKSVGAAIIEKFMETPMKVMFVKQDVRGGNTVAVVLHRSFCCDEVKHLGKFVSGVPFIAFSTSARRDVFFPTNWVKLVLEFRSSENQIGGFFISSVYPDAVGFSQSEALALLRR